MSRRCWSASATPDTRRQAVTNLRKGWFRGLPWEWDTIIISHVQSDANRDIVGKSVERIAEERNDDPAEVYLQLIDEEDNNVGCVAINRREDNIRFFMSQPYAMFGSDGSAISPTGIYGGDKPHPRFYGCYPRILGRYVREQPAVLSLEEAIYKAAGFPAERMGFKDRGLLKEGYAADIVVFDPDTVIDNATFDDPHRYPDGMPHVLVNGEPVILNGAHTGARPGPRPATRRIDRNPLSRSRERAGVRVTGPTRQGVPPTPAAGEGARGTPSTAR